MASGGASCADDRQLVVSTVLREKIIAKRDTRNYILLEDRCDLISMIVANKALGLKTPVNERY